MDITLLDKQKILDEIDDIYIRQQIIQKENATLRVKKSRLKKLLTALEECENEKTI